MWIKLTVSQDLEIIKDYLVNHPELEEAQFPPYSVWINLSQASSIILNINQTIITVNNRTYEVGITEEIKLIERYLEKSKVK